MFYFYLQYAKILRPLFFGTPSERYVEYSLAIRNLRKNDRRILDIGCWWGWFIRYVCEHGFEAHRFDYELNRIKDATDFLSNENGLCVGNAEEIPYKTNMFDIVFSYHLL